MEIDTPAYCLTRAKDATEDNDRWFWVLRLLEIMVFKDDHVFINGECCCGKKES